MENYFLFIIYEMSKSITGKSIDINLNITQAGTFNAGIFNATEDFTLNGVSIVDRITDLEEDKQDVLTIQQVITPSTTAVASSTAIIDYVASSTPTINANAPINYVGNTISATFDNAPTNGSINFLNSDKIYDALALKQDNLTIQQTITSSTTAVASSNAIINYVALATAISGLAPIVNNSGVISATFDNAPTNGSINFLNSDKIFDALALKQNNLTIQQTITPSTTAVASSTAIINYVASTAPTITGTAPINYSSGVISATFDTAPTNGSINFLSSDKIYDALALKQDLITSGTDITLNNLTSTTGTFSAPTILQSGTNLLQAIVANTSLIGTKQDILTIQQNITPSSVAVASATAIIDYVSTAVSNITATSPFTYISNTISALFDLAPISGSTRLLNSDRIFQALSSKQNLITSATNLTCNNLTNSVITTSGSITSTGGNIACITGNLSTATGSVIAPNIVQSGVNLLNAINNLTTEVDTKQDILTSFSNITTGSIDINGSIQINNNLISNGAGTIAINGLSGFISGTSITGGVVNSIGGMTANNDIVSNSGSVIAPTITGDIYNNLVAGENIVLSQNTPTIGKTTITALSGLATSTQYGFQATSTSFTNLTYNAGNVLNFNSVQLCFPSTSHYNTTNKTYVVQVAGYYTFGFKLFSNVAPTTAGRFGISKNNSSLGFGGAFMGGTEAIDVIAYCQVGDTINVKCEVGTSLTVFMGAGHSWFYGYLLQPENNTITSSTNLTIGSLNTAGINGDIATITDLTADDLIVNNTLTATTITGNIASNLQAGENIQLSTTGGITSITGRQRVFHAVLTTNYYAPAGTPTYSIAYDTIKINDAGYSYDILTGILTIQQTGRYSISASGNLFDVGYADRVIFRIRLRINGNWLMGYPQAYSYLRHNTYATYGTSVFSDAIFDLTAGDTIDISTGCCKASTTNFVSDFNGLQTFNGCYLSIRTL